MLISIIARLSIFGFTQSNLVMSNFCQRLIGNNVITLFYKACVWLSFVKKMFYLI